ncbi:hypothetical protein I5Q34_08240 [Streptomyces sp. AV19]|uniref:ISAzo13-like element transposase-related protein n=1 Tax=Streptomyces sp. AV19 TaxID=2793068 RepID=UPI0018FE3ED1|nr:hypothetical protein [Streptomyces sp. AV19]MBH1934284.1 hypothetical protein [Streptomyces sp. AV19]MDG4533406.1 hypothetical protein [Streptomyces sp. AV19]
MTNPTTRTPNSTTGQGSCPSAWRGRPLTSHEVIVQSIAATTTRTGLTAARRARHQPVPHRHPYQRPGHRRLADHTPPLPR